MKRATEMEKYRLKLIDGATGIAGFVLSREKHDFTEIDNLLMKRGWTAEDKKRPGTGYITENGRRALKRRFGSRGMASNG